MHTVYKKDFDIFNLKYVFIFLTFYFTVVPFLFNINQKTIISMGVVALGCLFFLIGYSNEFYFHIKKITIAPSKLLIYIGLLFMTSDVLIGAGRLTSEIEIADYTESFYIESYDNLYYQIFFIALFSLKYFVFSLLLSKSQLFFYCIFLSQVAISISSPTRLVALQPFIIFIIFGYYLKYININFTKIIISLFLAPILFVVMLLARGKTSGLSYFEIISTVLVEINFEKLSEMGAAALESFRSFEDLSNLIEMNFVHVESGIFRIIFMPISRGVWMEKPESISRIISKEFNNDQYINGGGTVATIFGDAFINGHIFGVISLLFLVGFFSRVIYNTVMKNIDISINQKSVLFVAYSIFIYDFIFYFRGFFSEFYWKTIIFQLCFIILYKIYFGVKFNLFKFP